MEMDFNMEKRLEKRYKQLVRSHMNSNDKLAAGVKTQLKNDIAFSQTQAAWRFLNNENATLMDLADPILKAGQTLCNEETGEYVLVAHDWSHLSYGTHKSKRDTYNTIRRNVGYELQTSLLLSASHGGPLSVAALSLKDKNKIHRSYSNETNRDITHLDELVQQIQWIESQKFSKRLVHVIDREADSVGFLRALEDKLWLTRGHGGYKVHDGNKLRKIQDIAKDLTFNEERTIELKGKKATQQIAEIEITILRPSQPRTKNADNRRVQPIAGKPVPCRLIVSRVINNDHEEVAIWYLLSNLGKEVDKTKIALWYYWRWSIESYFKLMKSAGMQLESWQQTTSLAIARRILVASMGCVCVWRVAHATGPEAGEIRRVLIRLSGRQMKWGKEFTYPALLAGLWSLLAIEDTLSNYGIEKLQSILASVFENILM
jgi:hypothetical protein